nr:MAG TPA: hypothetical protein [Caudoviricetes sp.]
MSFSFTVSCRNRSASSCVDFSACSFIFRSSILPISEHLFFVKVYHSCTCFATAKCTMFWANRK